LDSLESEYLFGLKNHFNVIDSVSVDYNGTNIIQTVRGQNILAQIKACTEWSTDDLRNLGPSLGFAVEEEESYIYFGATCSFGQGLCNNSNYIRNASRNSAIGHNTSQLQRGNKAFVQRLETETSRLDQGTVIGLNVLTNQALLDTQQAQRMPTTTNQLVKRFMVTLRLKDLGTSFFEKMAMSRMSNFRIVVNVNNSIFQVTKSSVTAATNNHNPTLAVTGTQPGLTLNSVTSSGLTNPLMFAATYGTSSDPAGRVGSAASVLDSSTNAVVCTCSFAVGATNASHSAVTNKLSTDVPCRLYVPAYVMSPQYMSQYLSLGQRKFEYEDFIQYNISSVAPTTTRSQIISSGIQGISKVILVPMLNGSNASNVVCHQMLSPFTDLVSAPILGGALTNVQVRLAGIDVIGQGGAKYIGEFYKNLVQGNGSINGGLKTGLSSGLISERMFTKNGYQFYIVDCARKPASEELLAQQVEVFLTNSSPVPLDVMVFVIFKRTFAFDVASGAQSR